MSVDRADPLGRDIPAIGRRTLMATAATTVIARPAWSEVTWQIVTEYPATAMPGEGVAFFAKIATAGSAGALSVEPGFDAPDGLRSAAMIRAVAAGRVTAADAFTGALAGEEPLFELSALPFLTDSTEDTARLLGIARDDYARTLARSGVTLLYATPWPATGLWSRTPIATPDAARGLRIRTYDDASTAVWRAIGAVPTRLSFADALPRVRAGDIDAVLSSGDGGAGARLWELLPCFTAIDYASPLSLAFCGRNALLALPDAAHASVTAAARETEARQFRSIVTRTAENDSRLRANGVLVASAPALRAALVAAAGPVINAWAVRAGPDGTEILRVYRSGK